MHELLCNGLLNWVDLFVWVSCSLSISLFDPLEQNVFLFIGKYREFGSVHTAYFNSIRVSRSLRDTAYKAIYAKENYVKKNLKEPTINEIAEEIGIEKEDIVYALDAIQSPVSIYEPVYTEGGDTLYVMDQISDKKNREENWIEDLSLKEAMKRLDDREKHIIEMRFYEGKTQMEVAREIGISQAQVSRLEKHALKNMKNYLRPWKSSRSWLDIHAHRWYAKHQFRMYPQPFNRSAAAFCHMNQRVDRKSKMSIHAERNAYGVSILWGNIWRPPWSGFNKVRPTPLSSEWVVFAKRVEPRYLVYRPWTVLGLFRVFLF